MVPSLNKRIVSLYGNELFELVIQFASMREEVLFASRTWSEIASGGKQTSDRHYFGWSFTQTRAARSGRSSGNSAFRGVRLWQGGCSTYVYHHTGF